MSKPVTKQQAPWKPKGSGRSNSRATLRNNTHLAMRSWIRLEKREYNQPDDEVEDGKDILCVAFFRLRLSLLCIVGLRLLLLVIGGCGVICKGFETERDADLIGLFEADAFFHVNGTGLRVVHAQETVTLLLFGYIYVIVPLPSTCSHIMKLPSTWISVTRAIKEARLSDTL